ncbi:Phosphomevalonate kinase [Xylona heveae TC161]|uniref:Phosphomevalonate kinase n=1 Tax=Xylona heveae (strain CBS 132557 / TC161) TaxID=1328760 RepID=A0A165HBB8_XYLHT|nr:Phosphomevalonate kinase [Xylona heveae TC161]KZF23250.1 Phosphomevalonate kinase [Xylona heveae TC161]
MTRPPTALSAPGKVLLAGGYLVLDRDYTGLVFGLDARIHVHVQPLSTSPGVVLSEIIVRSPQFRDAEWRYGYRLAAESRGIDVTQLKGLSTSCLSRNPFIETALTYALTYISMMIPGVIEASSITILADDDYYSQTASPGARRERFINFHVPLQSAHKTGLGSSAALVTAFTAGLLAHYLPAEQFDLKTDKGRAILHNLAQAAHCAAQGKVGSGFDVAAAVYGSCRYRRFSPALLEGLGEIGSRGFSDRLKALVEDTEPARKWDTEIIKAGINVPKGLRLTMCDVDCGSQTVGMVKQVLAWRKEHPEEANALWSRLQEKNVELGKQLSTLGDATRRSDADFDELKEVIADIRSMMRQMSKASGVPIEPQMQTELLDACSALPGVIGGVVPGAGGYDAVALLTVDQESVLGPLRKLLDEWKVSLWNEDGAVANGSIGKVRALGVREEMEGVRFEREDAYRSWIE